MMHGKTALKFMPIVLGNTYTLCYILKGIAVAGAKRRLQTYAQQKICRTEVNTTEIKYRGADKSLARTD